MALMTCRECRDELELWVGQSELPPGIASHIESCPDCKAYWDELRGLAVSVANDTAFQVTSAQASRIKAGIERRMQSEQSTTITSLHWLRVAAVAASVIIVTGIGITGYRANWFGHSVSTPNTTAVAVADTQTGNVAAEDVSEGLSDIDLSALESAVDSTTTLDDATVLDSLSDEQIQYLESNLDVRGLI
jgi:hypothetical protein